MPIRETDSNFESELFEQARAAFEAKFGVSQNWLPLPLLLVDIGAEKDLPCYEPAEETIAISTHVSARIHAWYEQLAIAYEKVEDPPAHVGIELEIELQKFDPGAPDCDHRLYHSRRLQLRRPEMLPDLSFVSSLTIKSEAGRNIETAANIRPLSPLVPLQCLVHLPAVQEWNAPWLWERPMPSNMPNRVLREHYTWPWEGPLRDARHEFGAAVIDQEKHLCGKRIPTSLTRAALHFWLLFNLPKHDQSVARPNLIRPADKDPVSVGLCKLGAQLRLFDVRVMITPDLFPSPEASSEQQWSQMRRFRLEFHTLCPDGRWYFVGPGGEDSEQGGYKISDTEHYPRETDTDEDEDLHDELNDNLGEAYDDGYDLNMFRVKPSRERIEPLLAAFAKSLALDNMPSLEDGEMFTHLWWAPSDDMEAKKYDLPTGKGHRWGVKSIAGRGSQMQESDRAADAAAPTPPVVQWWVGDWRPSHEVMILFENLGRQERLNIEWNKYRDTTGHDLLGNSQSRSI
jgi:hypothetical protein